MVRARVRGFLRVVSFRVYIDQWGSGGTKARALEPEIFRINIQELNFCDVKIQQRFRTRRFEITAVYYDIRAVGKSGIFGDLEERLVQAVFIVILMVHFTSQE